MFTELSALERQGFSREELAAVLAEHCEVYDSDCGLYFGCTCGWDNDTDEHNIGYPEHVAAVLLASPVLTRLIREENAEA